MVTRRPSKWLVGLGVVGGIVLLLALGGWLGWQAVQDYFVQAYYQQSYQPTPLAASQLGAYPAEYHLQDVPWIAYDQPVCQSASLQMLAAQRGLAEPRRHFDFLMGFTYGASSIPGKTGFAPYTDPEPGFLAAAPYLGLTRRYYITDSPDLFLQALRYYLSQGYAVRLPLNMSRLYNAQEFLGHSEVLVGYAADGFYFYETVCLPPATCQAGEQAPGAEGIYVSYRTLLEAVADQAKSFFYSWRYTFVVFEPGPVETDLGPIWKRNGQLLIGGNPYGPKQGADAIEALAAQLEQRGVKLHLGDLRIELETAVYLRHENGNYLREAFPGKADLEQAAALFDQAAGDYQRTLDAVSDGLHDQTEANQAAGWLRDAAQAERQVGDIFLAHSP